jgi:glucan biosynthesis protein C
MPLTNQRIAGLDALRILVTFLGIIMHASVSYMTNPPDYWAITDSYRNIYFNLIGFILHSFRMEIYFVIAGICTYLLYQKGLTHFIQSRIRQIVIPFLLIVLPMGAIIPLACGLAPFSLNKLQPFHLWMLYYLFAYYLVILLGQKIINTSGMEISFLTYAFEKIIQSKYRIFILSLFCLPWLALMRTPIVDIAIGPPHWPIMTYYGVFFIFGWGLGSNQAWFKIIQRYCFSFLLLAFLLSVGLGSSIDVREIFSPSAPAPSLLFRYLYGIAAWLYVFAITGICTRFFHTTGEKMRYLAEATYWIFIAHLPLIFWQQHLLNQIALPGVVKFFLIVLMTPIILLLIYHFIIRRFSAQGWYLDNLMRWLQPGIDRMVTWVNCGDRKVPQPES